MKKRILAFVLTLVLIVGLFPITAQAYNIYTSVSLNGKNAPTTEWNQRENICKTDDRGANRYKLTAQQNGWYEFESYNPASGGDPIIVVTNGRNTSLEDTIKAHGYMHGSDVKNLSNLVGYDDDSGESNNFKLKVYLIQNHDYYVYVTNYSNGKYIFSFKYRISPDSSSPTIKTGTISVGDSKPVSVSNGVPAYRYSFTAPYTGTFQVQSSGRTGSLDPHVVVSSSSSTTDGAYKYIQTNFKSSGFTSGTGYVTSDNDSAGSQNFKVSFNLTAGTTYYIFCSRNEADIEGDYTVKLTCTGRTYTIQYDPNYSGGSATSNSVSGGASSVSFTTKAALTREGYTFAGWNTKADGTGTNYNAGASVSNMATDTSNTITLYAKWVHTHSFTGDYVIGTGADEGKHGQKCVYDDCTEIGEWEAHSFTGDLFNYEDNKWAQKCVCGAYDTANTKTGVAVPTAKTGLVYNGDTQTGVEAGTGYSIESNTGKDAGTYTATATLKDGYIWADGTTEAKTIVWSIAKATVAVPTITGNKDNMFLFTGEEIVALESNDYYTVENGSATATGKYTAKVTPTKNYEWAENFDGEIEWSIVSREKYNLLNEECEVDWLMARQGKIINGKVSDTVGRTIIPLTQAQLDSIDEYVWVVASDGNKDFKVKVDCAYTYFYDIQNGEQVMITAEELGYAAFIIIDNDGTENADNTITGFGYYRVYKDEIADDEHFMLDALYLDPMFAVIPKELRNTAWTARIDTEDCSSYDAILTIGINSATLSFNGNEYTIPVSYFSDPELWFEDGADSYFIITIDNNEVTFFEGCVDDIIIVSDSSSIEKA